MSFINSIEKFLDGYLANHCLDIRYFRFYILLRPVQEKRQNLRTFGQSLIRRLNVSLDFFDVRLDEIRRARQIFCNFFHFALSITKTLIQ